MLRQIRHVARHIQPRAAPARSTRGSLMQIKTRLSREGLVITTFNQNLHDSWNHVQILSQGEGGFFADAGYLEIEDHGNKTWSPSTAMSEVACAQNALAKKLASAAEATAATAVAEAAQRR